MGKVFFQQSGNILDVDGLGFCVYFIYMYFLKIVFFVELVRVFQSELWEDRDFVVRLLDMFGYLKQNIEFGDMLFFFVEEYNFFFGENSIVERIVCIWILDVIFLFFLSKDDMQFG